MEYLHRSVLRSHYAQVYDLDGTPGVLSSRLRVLGSLSIAFGKAGVRPEQSRGRIRNGTGHAHEPPKCELGNHCHAGPPRGSQVVVKKFCGEIVLSSCMFLCVLIYMLL